MIKVDNSKEELMIKGELAEIGTDICMVFKGVNETLEQSEFNDFKISLLCVIFDEFFNDKELIALLERYKDRYCNEE